MEILSCRHVTRSAGCGPRPARCWTRPSACSGSSSAWTFRAAQRVAWQPPVDVFEDEREFVVVVALPGVSPGNAEAKIDGRTLLVRARRGVSLPDRACSIERLEIPYGYFERRLVLPQMRLELDSRQWSDGCLVLTIRKTR